MKDYLWSKVTLKWVLHHAWKWCQILIQLRIDLSSDSTRRILQLGGGNPTRDDIMRVHLDQGDILGDLGLYVLDPGQGLPQRGEVTHHRAYPVFFDPRR